MRQPARAVVLATALASALCCRTTRERSEVPARIVSPTPASRAELSQAVSEALHDPSVRLADDALTADSVLLVDRVQQRDASGLPLQGRELGRPERFDLVKSGSACILAHGEERFTLAATTCVPVGQ